MDPIVWLGWVLLAATCVLVAYIVDRMWPGLRRVLWMRVLYLRLESNHRAYMRTIERMKRDTARLFELDESSTAMHRRIDELDAAIDRWLEGHR